MKITHHRKTTDIHCAICNEPYDSYGVSHGDLAKWEAKLFLAGKGCPSCATHGIDAPEFVEPAPQVLHQCVGCQSQLIVENDTNDRIWTGRHVPEFEHTYNSNGWKDAQDIEVLQADYTIDGVTYCPHCVENCGDCSEVTLFRMQWLESGDVAYGDTYDSGASFPDPRSYFAPAICIGCLEAIPTCANCGQVQDDSEDLNEDGFGDCCRSED